LKKVNKPEGGSTPTHDTPKANNRDDLLASIRAGKALKRVDHQLVQVEKKEIKKSKDLFSSLKETMAMALEIRREALKEEEEDEWDSDDDMDEDW
jgi:hypothetical protein